MHKFRIQPNTKIPKPNKYTHKNKTILNKRTTEFINNSPKAPPMKEIIMRYTPVGLYPIRPLINLKSAPDYKITKHIKIY